MLFWSIFDYVRGIFVKEAEIPYEKHLENYYRRLNEIYGNKTSHRRQAELDSSYIEDNNFFTCEGIEYPYEKRKWRFHISTNLKIIFPILQVV